jgi:hypothetical protein
MSSTVIEVALNDLEDSEEERIEQLVETLANDVVPSLAEAAGVSGTALAARLMIEMAYICGFTHHPADAVDLMTSVSQAIRAGISDNEQASRDDTADEPAEPEVGSDSELDPFKGPSSDRLH